MALVSSSSQYDRYSVAASELQDHVVDIYGNKENELELFRYMVLHFCSHSDVFS
jgi:hypothetical protein